MKKYGFTALLTASVMCASMVSCGGKKSSSGTDSSSAGDTSQTAETTAAVSQEETTAVTTASAEPASGQTTEPATSGQKDEGGYDDSTALAQDFYNAYLSHDAEAVYNMFDKEEISGYNRLIRDELEGKDPEEVFSKKAVIGAIDQSMSSIEEIMDAYSDTSQDVWTVEITAADLEAVDEAQLDDFNGDLGTTYTDALVVNYIFYMDQSNDQSFTGNSSAYLERNGKWYLSYSSLMQSELINYIDV